MENKVNLGRRFLAYLIDWYVGALFTGIPVSITSQKLYGTMLNQSLLDFGTPYGIYAGVVGIIFASIYYIIYPTYIANGQTFGKKVTKIRIVTDKDEKVKLKHMLLRQGVGIFFIEGALISASSIFHQLLNLVFKVDFVKPCMYIGIVISIISVILLLLSRGNKAIHDFIGKTKVINVN